MVKRSRLSRGNSRRRTNRLDKLRQSLALELKDEPSHLVEKYSKLSDKKVVDNPALALLRTEAREELAERQKSLQDWRTGKLPPEEAQKRDKPLIKKILGNAKGFKDFVGKAFGEYMKVISGEKARELEEAIATVGMKPKEKKKYLEEERGRQAKAEREELEEEESFYPGRMPEHAKENEQFVRERKELDRDVESVRAQEPEYIKSRREELEEEDFSLGKVLPPEKRNGDGSPTKPIPKPPVREEPKSSTVTVNVNVGGQQVSPGEKRVAQGKDLHDVSGFLDEEKQATQREMDRPFEDESVQDIIEEGRAEVEEEQRQVAKEKKQIFEED